jgi:acyl-coenzyme A thioesterase PaaI-like protein
LIDRPKSTKNERLKVIGTENQAQAQIESKCASSRQDNPSCCEDARDQAVESNASSQVTASCDAAPEQTAPGSEVLNPACFVCGEENANGLRVPFQAEGRRASATWTPGAGWESYKGVIHGGIISSVLDEAMSKAILSGGDEAFTAELRIRFRKKVSVAEVVMVNGWVVSAAKRRILAEATLTSENGEEKAHAWGVFLAANHR